MRKTMLQYPAPVYPERIEEVSDTDQLMPYARRALQRTSGRGELGTIKPGEKVLLVAPPGQDRLVLEAIMHGFNEKGIEVASIGEEEVAGIPREKLSKQNQREGWAEVYWRDEIVEILGLEKRTLIEVKWYLEGFFDRYPEYVHKYDKIIVGAGGRRFHRIAMGKYGSKFGGTWVYDSPEALQSKVDAFPSDVLALIERKVLEPLDRVSEVRITDPQGTDVSFSVPPDEARVWRAAQPLPGHLLMYPFHSLLALDSDPVLSSLKAKFAAEGLNTKARHTTAEGVIAGTANHTGYFPHMKTYLKEGQVYKVEGGGKFGDLVREVLEATKNTWYPGYPRPGYLYLVEIALGTGPKFIRRRVDMRLGGYPLFINSYERQRSGVLHWGIGLDDFDPEFIKYAKGDRLPRNHMGHAAHTYFNTIEFKMRDTGERVKIVDKGHLSALDDPEVRSLAGKYGDPEDILSEEWIPAIPGINYPGNYMDDYGKDPTEWVTKEIEEQLPATMGVPK